MSGHDLEPKKPSSGRLGFLGRTKAMSSGGSVGWEAATIGFTLVGCIAAGSGLGYFLDARLGTNYWLPILFLVGVAAGFREMFLVLGRISKDQEVKKREQEQNVILAPNPTKIATSEEPKARERIFQVPPPPIPGQKPIASESNEPESVEDLIERLLAEDEDESESDKSK